MAAEGAWSRLLQGAATADEEPSINTVLSPRGAIVDESWYTSEGVSRVAATPAARAGSGEGTSTAARNFDEFELAAVELWAVDNFLCQAHPACRALEPIEPA